MTVLHLDFESASRLNLSKVGASRYSRDASTIVTCLAWAFDDAEPEIALLPQVLPPAVEAHLRSGGVYHAWNASFETAILRNYFAFRLKPDQAICTMQRALHAGLPAALEDAGPALGLGVLKDKTARAVDAADGQAPPRRQLVARLRCRQARPAGDLLRPRRTGGTGCRRNDPDAARAGEVRLAASTPSATSAASGSTGS